MKIFVFGLLVVLRLIGSSSADLTLFPIGQELLFSWTANVTSGIVLPSSLESSWGIDATIIVQQVDSNSTYFQIKNEGGDLEMPFVGVFQDGELTSISVHPEDEMSSVNMKRAVLSLLQLKLVSVNSMATNYNENGLYGRCFVEVVYAESSTGDSKVRKKVDLDSCTGLSFEKFENLPVSLCSGPYLDGVTAHSDREYILHSINGTEKYLKSVEGTGRVLFQPFRATAEAHYSKISQKITLQSSKPVEVPIINNTQSLVSADVVYQRVQLDPTYGKRPKVGDDLVDEIFTLLGELSDSLSTWEVGVRGLDNQTSFYIVDLMVWLTVDDWDKLCAAVTVGTSYRQETIQHLFWDLVPQVGSEAAVIFIKNLVKSEKLKGIMAGRLLVNFPFYLKEASEELLTNCEELLRLDEKISLEVRQSAVLSFATLIYKVCKEANKCKQDTMDRYAKLYLDKFMASKTYENQMLYIQGLSNIELEQVLDFLGPVISGTAETNKNKRFLAIWTTMPVVYSNPNKMYDVYWPIFTNTSEALELRVAALTLLIMSRPTPSRFFSIYWHMQSERSEQLYSFYYTTIHSLAATNFPCYEPLGRVAGKLVRFVHPRSRHWATGNYILDFEDQDRSNGALFQTLLIASEKTGLPNVFMFMVEFHSLGHFRMYTLYLKLEGLDAALREELDKISNLDDTSHNKMNNVLKLLNNLKVPLQPPEDLHLELMLKIDGRTVVAQYMNRTNFNNWSEVIKRLSSLYFEFSVNYQSLNFPVTISLSRPSDLGAPALVQVRSASLISTRGSISQENEGKARNAELDLRYSLNAVTTLKMYNPLMNTWHGADRCRNLHIRLPFSTHLILQMAQSVFKATAVRHKDFVIGSRLGLVWHASSRLVSRKPLHKFYPNISDEWTMDSEDLGVRLGASVFDCDDPNTLPSALHLLKKAFLANHKNYNMIPGGVVLLGLLSLRDQLQFQPEGSNCGVMLYFTPLLTQVEMILHVEGESMKISMRREDGLIWEIIAGSRRLSDGNKEVTFKLYRAPSVSVTVAHIWRVIQLEGAFIVPSKVSGVFHPPAALTGYAFLSWGDATPSQSDKAAMLDIKLLPGVHNETVACDGFVPACLQAASDAAARQTVSLQYANVKCLEFYCSSGADLFTVIPIPHWPIRIALLFAQLCLGKWNRYKLPGWLKMAAHALFPEHIQTDSTRTQVTFAYPVALLPWNSKGLCALNSRTILTLDNATLPLSLNSCYSLAMADCSKNTSFSIQVKKVEGLMATNIFGGADQIELYPRTEAENTVIGVKVNGVSVDVNNQGYERIEKDKRELSVRVRTVGIIEVELKTGVILQHYNSTVVILVPATFRGYTCGLCGKFNGETSNEPMHDYNDNCINN